MEENLHAFWDDIIGEQDVKWFSEITDSSSGIGLQMFEVRDSYSTGGGSKSGYGIYVVSEGTFECLDTPCFGNAGVCGRFGLCEEWIFESKVNATISVPFHRCACHDYYGGAFCQFNPNDAYTRDHFLVFQSNKTAALEPSPYEYQSRYWQPVLAAAEAEAESNKSTNEIAQEVTANGDETSAETVTDGNETGNVFKKAKEGEL